MIRKLYSKGLFHLFTARFLTQFLGFGSVILVAKFLTPEELGGIKLIQSYTAIFIVLAGFGLSSGLLKVCSENLEEDKKQTILEVALGKSIYFIAAAMLLLLGLAYFGLMTNSRQISLWLIAYAIIIPFSVMTDMLMIYLQASKKIKEMSQAQAQIKVVSFVLVVAATYYYGFIGFILSSIAGFILGFMSVLKYIRFKFRTGKLPQQFLHASTFGFMSNIVSIVAMYVDVIIMDHVATSRESIGYYSLATYFLMAAMQVTSVVQQFTTPYMCEKTDNRAWVKKQFYKVQLGMSGISLLVAAALYLGAYIIIHFMYGQQYAASLDFLQILMLKYVIYSSFAITGVVMFALGNFKYNFISSLSACVMNIVLSYVLMLNYGINGIAWGQVAAACVAFCISFAFILYIFNRGQEMHQHQERSYL